MPARSVTDEDLERIEVLIGQGRHPSQIAAEIGKSYNCVYYWVVKMGLSVGKSRIGRGATMTYIRNGKTIRGWTMAQDEELQKLRTQNFQHAEIARRMGRAPNSISARLNLLAYRQEILEPEHNI